MMPSLDQLQKDVHRYATAYAAASSQNPALAPYSLAALVEKLRPGTSTNLSTDATRLALLTALLLDAQRSKHPLWTSLLATAFAPMLRRIRRQTIPCHGETSDDIDQRVVLAFVEAVGKVDPTHVAIGLRWATQDAAWGSRNRELRKEEPIDSARADEFDERGDRVWFDGESFEVDVFEQPELERCEDLFAEEDAMLTRVEARRIARELDAKGERKLLHALLADDLHAYVEATTSHLSSKERAAEYWRVKQQRRRLGRNAA